jgi:DNA polymerase I
VLAHVADIPALKQAFADGLDIHAMTASEMFGVPVEGHARWCAAAPRRSISASSTASPPSASPTSSASRASEAKAPISRPISSASPASATTWSDQGLLPAHGYVTTVFGRRVHYPGINESKNPSERGFNERAAINAPIQGSAADIIRRAMIRMERPWRKRGSMPACCCRCMTN